MDSILTQQIAKSVSEGNMVEFAGYVLIFVFLWIEVRGMKTELKNLNFTVSKSFADGERRFTLIEENQKNYEHRLTVLEKTRGNT